MGDEWEMNGSKTGVAPVLSFIWKVTLEGTLKCREVSQSYLKITKSMQLSEE